MSNRNLQTEYIKDSYTGLLHSSGQPLPADGVTTMYDGSGQASALSLGLSSKGANINGPFNVTGNTSIVGNETVSGNLTVGGATTTNTLSVTTTGVIGGSLTVNGDLRANLSLTGASLSAANNVSCNTLTVSNSAFVANRVEANNLVVDPVNLTVLAPTSIQGTLSASGLLTASGIRYPDYSPSIYGQIVSLPPNSNLAVLKTFMQLLFDSGWNTGINGEFENPTLTFLNGILTDIVDGPDSKGVSSFTSTGDSTFSIPDRVNWVKVIVTGGGGFGGSGGPGSAGATAIAYLNTKNISSRTFTVTIGGPGAATTLRHDGTLLITANAGQNQGGGGGTATRHNTSIVTSFVHIPGGSSAMDIDDNSEETTGVASYWGGTGTFGAGQGAGNSEGRGNAGSGVVVFEW